AFTSHAEACRTALGRHRESLADLAAPTCVGDWSRRAVGREHPLDEQSYRVPVLPVLMRRRASSFLKLWAAVLAAMLAAIAAFNFAMDPYSYFGVRLQGINDTKPRPDFDLTNVKRSGFRQVDASAV